MACENLATRRLREFHAAVGRTEGCKARDGRAATTGVGRHHIMKYRKETGGMAKTGPKVVRPVKQKTLRKTSARKAKPEPTPKGVEEHNKSNLPYASCCKIRAKEDAHRQRKDVVAGSSQYHWLRWITLLWTQRLSSLQLRRTMVME